MVTDRTITPPEIREGPYSWPSREQREAYRAALEYLFNEYPTVDAYELKYREIAIDTITSSLFFGVREAALRGGVPEERIDALEALLF